MPWPETQAVGGWWNRQFNPEIDLVGADHSPVATRIHFTGTIKWLATPFDHHDLTAHHAAATQIPGHVPATTGTVIVSLSGISNTIDARGVEVVWGPADITEAWQ